MWEKSLYWTQSTLENTERLIKNEQSRETGNIEYEDEDTTIHKQIT